MFDRKEKIKKYEKQIKNNGLFLFVTLLAAFFLGIMPALWYFEKTVKIKVPHHLLIIVFVLIFVFWLILIFALSRLIAVYVVNEIEYHENKEV